MRQSERRAATRRRLLDAAMACLVEHGHLGFRTADVVRRAGSSQGALFDHFPTKDALLGATVEHLFAAMRADYEQRFIDLPAERRTVSGGLRLLWEVFGDERIHAAYELYTAARTDPTLRAALDPVVREHAEGIVAVADALLGRELAGRGIDPTRFADLVQLAVVAMQGLTLERLARDVPGADERLLALLESLASDAGLAGPVPADLGASA